MRIPFRSSLLAKRTRATIPASGHAALRAPTTSPLHAESPINIVRASHTAPSSPALWKRAAFNAAKLSWIPLTQMGILDGSVGGGSSNTVAAGASVDPLAVAFVVTMLGGCALAATAFVGAIFLERQNTGLTTTSAAQYLRAGSPWLQRTLAHTVRPAPPAKTISLQHIETMLRDGALAAGTLGLRLHWKSTQRQYERALQFPEYPPGAHQHQRDKVWAKYIRQLDNALYALKDTAFMVGTHKSPNHLHGLLAEQVGTLLQRGAQGRASFYPYHRFAPIHSAADAWKLAAKIAKKNSTARELSPLMRAFLRYRAGTMMLRCYEQECLAPHTPSFRVASTPGLVSPRALEYLGEARGHISAAQQLIQEALAHNLGGALRATVHGPIDQQQSRSALEADLARLQRLHDHTDIRLREHAQTLQRLAREHDAAAMHLAHPDRTYAALLPHFTAPWRRHARWRFANAETIATQLLPGAMRNYIVEEKILRDKLEQLHRSVQTYESVLEGNEPPALADAMMRVLHQALRLSGEIAAKASGQSADWLNAQLEELGIPPRAPAADQDIARLEEVQSEAAAANAQIESGAIRQQFVDRELGTLLRGLTALEAGGAALDQAQDGITQWLLTNPEGWGPDIIQGLGRYRYLHPRLYDAIYEAARTARPGWV